MPTKTTRRPSKRSLTRSRSIRIAATHSANVRKCERGRNKYDLALPDVNKAIALDPNNPELYESRAQIRVQLNNDVAGALADYDKALKLDPKRSETYMERAWVHATLKNNAAAIADYDSAIALKQDDSSLYVQRGEMYYRTHDYVKAMADWKKALELKHDDSATYNAMAWLLATSPDPKVRDGKKAIELATKACELSEWKKGEVVDTLAAAYAEGATSNVRWSSRTRRSRS